MPDTRSPVLFYASILEPWTSLAIGAPSVVGLRLTLMPLLWLTNPLQANNEVSRMFTEKNDALRETSIVMSTAPMQLWFDTLSICLSANPQARFCRAVIDSGRRAARPANRRVRANSKRLSGQKN